MRILVIVLLFSGFTAIAQPLKELTPVLGYLVEKSAEGEASFYQQLDKCKKLWARSEETYTQQEKQILEDCNQNYDGVENYYDILGPGCSWYCGGGIDTQTASSELKSQGQNTYSAGNAHDLSYKTAWVEGVPGYGVGEYLTYHFPPENPRITKIIVVNGYAKTPEAWKRNSRVKRLKMYVNEKPYAILNLKDVKNEQGFDLGKPIGYSERSDLEKLKSRPPWTIKFEIMEVYKGERYDDTAITEIYFEGIDVH